MEIKPIYSLPEKITYRPVRRTYFVLTTHLNPDSPRLRSVYIEKVKGKNRFKDFDYVYLLNKSGIKHRATKTIIRRYAISHHLLYPHHLYAFLIGIYSFRKQSYLLIKNLNYPI